MTTAGRENPAPGGRRGGGGLWRRLGDLPVRARLAVLYALVFLVAGGIYISVNFGLEELLIGEEEDNSGMWEAMVGMLVITAIAVAAGWLVAERALRPLRSVTSTARRVTTATLDERIELEGPEDEIKELADTIDALLDRLQTGIDRERHFVANASHELRTPLSVTRTALELALATDGSVGSEGPDYRSSSEPGGKATGPEAGSAPSGGCGDPARERRDELIRQALRSTARSEKLISDLLLLARSESLDTADEEPIDLADVVREVTADTGPRAREAGVTLEVSADPAPVRANPGLLDRLVANLVDNAVGYNIGTGGWVRITTREEGAAVVLTATNPTSATADGSSPADPADPADSSTPLFEPFRRARDRDRPTGADRGGDGREPAGYGLGLSIVRAIAGAHGGTVQASIGPPAADAGTQAVFRVELRLPSSASASASAPEASAGNEQIDQAVPRNSLHHPG